MAAIRNHTESLRARFISSPLGLQYPASFPETLNRVNTARFLIEVQRKAGQPADVRDPLAVTRTFISSYPTSQEAQVLRHLVRALVSGRGMFGTDDLEALSPEGAQLAAALIDSQMRALYTEKAWRSAALSLVSS